MQEKVKSGQTGDLLERSERGGESYIRLQRNPCGEIVPAPHLKEGEEQTPENKGSRGNAGTPADKSREEDKGS